MQTLNPEKSILSTGKYTIELSDGPSVVFKIDEEGNKQWLCSVGDPAVAMDIIEGLILVENKRFYYPESKPQINTVKTKGPQGSFLKKV